MIRPHTSLALLSAAWLVAPLVAAPVPKSDPDADKLLARVRVENVGSLLAQPTVTKALDLTEKQAGQLDELTDKLTAQFKQDAAAITRRNPNDSTAAMLEVFMAISGKAREFDAEAVRVLTPEQSRRLKQIQLQKEGPAALLSRHGIRAINPTAEQEDRMSAELAKLTRPPMFEEVIAMSTGAGGPPGTDSEKACLKLLEKYAADQDKVQEAMLNELSKEQRAAWRKMTGDPLPTVELLKASSALGEARMMKAVDEAQDPPPVAVPVPVQGVPPVLPGGGVPPPQLPPPPPLPVEKK